MRERRRSQVRKPEPLEARWALNASDYAGGFGTGVSESGQQIAIQGELGTLVLRDGKVSRYSDDDKLDASFGVGGFVDLGGPFNYLSELAADSLDRVLVGVKYLSRDQESELFRFLPDGTPDTTFGDEGRVVFARPGILETIKSLAPLADGGVLIGLHGSGNSGSVDALVRLDSLGQIAPTFGENGWYSGRIGQLLTPTVSDTGEIYLNVGNDAATRISVQRLTDAGAIDLSYGDSGTVQVPFEGIGVDLGELEVDGQGRVLVQFVDKVNQVKILRIDEQGVIDRGFGVDGLTTLSFPYTEYAVPCGIEVQANGRVLMGFFTVNYSMTWPTQYVIYRSYLTRLTPDGDADVTFGADGILDSRPAWYVQSRLSEFFVRADGEVVASMDSPGRTTAFSGSVSRLLGDPVNQAPTAIELSSRFAPEDAQAGYVVGVLTAIDNGPLATGLALLVDRDDLSVRVVNPTNQTQTFDNYRLRSSTHQLSRTGWRSIADWVASGPEAKAEAEKILGVGHTNWKEAVADSSTLWEAADLWARLEPGAEIELGKPFRSFPSDVDFAVIDSLGTKYGEVMWEPAPPSFELLDSAGGLFRLDGNRLVVSDPSALDFESTKQYTLRVRTTDEGGLSYTQDLVVDVENINEPPTIDAPAVWLGQPSVPLLMSGIGLADPDLQGDDLNTKLVRLRLTADRGIVEIASVAGLAVLQGANGTSLLEVEGTLPALNAALATLSFKADAAFSGAAFVSLSVDDQGNMGSGPARVTQAALRVTVNSVPVASPDRFYVAFGGALRGAAVLANDTDLDGDRMTALLEESPRHGTLQFAADGSFDYVPEPGFAGRDSFRYRAVDGFFAFAAVSVLLDVGTGDANLDGQVDLADFGILKQHFGTGTTRAEGDFNGDGRVDLTDFGILKAAFGVAQAADGEAIDSLTGKKRSFSLP